MTHPRPRPRASHATPRLAFLTEAGTRCDGQFSTRHREAQDVKGVPPAYTDAPNASPHHEAQDRRAAPGVVSHSAMGMIGGISPYRVSTVPGKITHFLKEIGGAPRSPSSGTDDHVFETVLLDRV